LARPWYRDWVLSAVVIGMGFVLSSPGGPLQGWSGLLVMIIGACIFLAAAIHGIVSLFRRKPPQSGRVA
jgi:hypothetical protein